MHRYFGRYKSVSLGMYLIDLINALEQHIAGAATEIYLLERTFSYLAPLKTFPAIFTSNLIPTVAFPALNRLDVFRLLLANSIGFWGSHQFHLIFTRLFYLFLILC
jgi:hypothetical protein